MLLGTRPDTAFAMIQLNKRNTNPREEHLQAAKCVLRYLKGTIYLKVNYKTSKDKISLYGLVGYANSNYAGNSEDCKFVMRYCFFVNRALVFWSSKNQRTVSNSTTKAEYIVLSHTVHETIWIRHFLNELKIGDYNNVCTLHKNNKTSIFFTKNAESQSLTKYIDVQHYYIKKLVTNSKFMVKWVCSTKILANGFIKALTVDNFYCHRSLLGLSI